MEGPDLQTLRAHVLAVFPELGDATFTLLNMGWDSAAVDVDGRLIFKFPRNGEAETRLRSEADLLAVIRPAVTIRVPDLTIVDGPVLFSRHEKIPGEHLLADHYAALAEDQRNALADAMGLFFAQLHAIPLDTMRTAGGQSVQPWMNAEEIRAGIMPQASSEWRDFAAMVLDAYQALGPDPYETIYGFFDGHGWNMAFDHAAGRLNGVYDFGDSGFGPVHREFVYPSFISPDLTDRIITAYETHSGRRIDRERVRILTGAHRLWELADLIDHPEHGLAMLKSLLAWIEASR